MPSYPEYHDLLRALAAFLYADVRPVLTAESHPGLRFRTLVAAHLAERMADEVAVDGQLVADELAALARALTPASTSGTDALVGDRSAQRARIAELRTELARRIRADDLDESQRAVVRAELRAVMGARLAVQSPKFVLTDEIERAPGRD